MSLSSSKLASRATFSSRMTRRISRCQLSSYRHASGVSIHSHAPKYHIPCIYTTKRHISPLSNASFTIPNDYGSDSFISQDGRVILISLETFMEGLASGKEGSILSEDLLRDVQQELIGESGKLSVAATSTREWYAQYLASLSKAPKFGKGSPGEKLREAITEIAKASSANTKSTSTLYRSPALARLLVSMCTNDAGSKQLRFKEDRKQDKNIPVHYEWTMIRPLDAEEIQTYASAPSPFIPENDDQPNQVTVLTGVELRQDPCDTKDLTALNLLNHHVVQSAFTNFLKYNGYNQLYPGIVLNGSRFSAHLYYLPSMFWQKKATMYRFDIVGGELNLLKDQELERAMRIIDALQRYSTSAESGNLTDNLRLLLQGQSERIPKPIQMSFMDLISGNYKDDREML